MGEWLFGTHGAGWAFLVAGALPAAAVLLSPVLPDHRPAGPAESGAKPPMLHPAAFGPGLVILLGFLGFIAFQAYLPLYADEISLDRPELVFLMYAGIVIVVRTLGADMPDRLGAARTGTIASLAVAVGSRSSLWCQTPPRCSPGPPSWVSAWHCSTRL